MRCAMSPPWCIYTCDAGSDVYSEDVMGGDDALYVVGGESANGGWQVNCRMAELAAVMRRAAEV
jgi:hypothetical protein